ncbi:putative alpha-1,2-mannosidase [Arenibacter algicola]|uniref:Alpha-1,2-mannosidase n=1 Tax=Arenibacter algicola TaxID=616991 RepID=A0ABY3AEC3_9FLAO
MRYFIVKVCLMLTICTSVNAQSSSQKLIWNIGRADESHGEFALASNRYADFTPEGFGGANRYYVVGKSDPEKDWPYILPGPKDEFAGYGYWAGLALSQLPIYFETKKLSKMGDCTLTFYFLTASSDQAPLFRCTINGNTFEHQLKNGSFKTPENLRPELQKISFDIPVEILRTGVNEIILQNVTGKWCAFDAIEFTGPADMEISTPGNTLIHSALFAEFESKKENSFTHPLLVDIRHKGKKASVKAILDEVEIVLPMEEGHSILEFEFPVLESKKKSRLKIFVNGKLKYSDYPERSPEKNVRLSDYVDQFMGTSGSRWMIAPGPWMPMAMMKIAPENEDSKWKAGYDYQIENIMGFSHIHEWTMAGLLMMPSNGPLKIQPGPEINPDLGYRSRIDKKSEKAAVGKYEVNLTDYDIDVELTATTRASMQRYSLPLDKENRILIDLHFPSEYVWELRDAEIRKISDTEIEGWAVSHCSSTGYPGEQDYTLYFVIQLDQPMKNMGGWVLDRIIENTDVINKRTYEPAWGLQRGWEEQSSGFITRGNKANITDAGAFINFNQGAKEIKIRTGISLVSTEQARMNLEEEMVQPFGWDFEAVVENQKKAWDDILGRVEIVTTDYLQKVKFYSNFYRAVSPRTTWSDVNGQWVDMDEKVQQTHPDRPIYGSDAFWGTHWNLVQFYNLIMPEYASNWINTFIELYDKGGWLPRGNPGMEYVTVMPGEAAIPLMVSAYQHGIRDYDTHKMMEAIYHQQTSMPETYPGGGRVGNESYNHYLEKGYVPLNNDNQSYVSNTMEYAYQDWCVAQLAKSMGLDSIYKPFMKRSENWRNIFDKETGFVRPKNKDGSWYNDFSPFYSPGFCESNSWQYTWYVPQNLPGLIGLMGKNNFVTKLNEAMEASEKVYFNALGDDFSRYPINHGNESNMQSSYLFNHADAPWLTQKWTRAIQEKYYGLEPRDAYPGDEDQGQMSAWYVMSALGLFQMDGGAATSPHYELGSPRFEKVTIHLSDKYYDGNTFTITAKNASRENKYINAAKLNGKKWDTWKIPQKEIIKGGELILEMQDVPNKELFNK